MNHYIAAFFLVFVFSLSPTVAVQESDEPEEIIEMKTSAGTIYIWLYKDIPLHRENFLKLTKEGHYNGTLFHRVITDFMIQGGDPYSKRKDKQDSLGEGDVGYTVKAEFNRKYFHKRGVIAAARNPDDVNPNRESSGCQFYIVQGKKMTDEGLTKDEKRIQTRLKDTTYQFTDYERKCYKEMGGTPWLDQQYTIFGEVISGMEVVDKIAAAKRDKKDRPLKNIKMEVKVIRLRPSELLTKFNYKIPA